MLRARNGQNLEAIRQGMLHGLTNAEIAASIGLKTAGVKWHVTSILKEYDCKNKQEFASKVLNRELTELTQVLKQDLDAAKKEIDKLKQELVIYKEKAKYALPFGGALKEDKSMGEDNKPKTLPSDGVNNESEPKRNLKEWYLYKHGEPNKGYYTVQPITEERIPYAPGIERIHVIQYSAYQSVCAELEGLKEEYTEQGIKLQQANRRYVDLFSANANLKSAKDKP